MYRVLIVDDEPWALIVTRKVFKWEENGFTVIAETTSSQNALDIICSEQPDIVFIDIQMPEMNGIELIKNVRQRKIDTDFIIVSGFAQFSYAQEAIQNGALDYCLKPLDPTKSDDLLKKIHLHLENKRKLKNAEMHELLMKSFEQQNEKQPLYKEANASFIEMIEYIKENYNQVLYLKDLAAKFYINQFYCCELFNKFMGKTFSEYVVTLRIDKASELIKNKNISIEKVSEMVGYSDYYYFNKVFKKYCGITPAQYRKNHCYN